MRLSKVLGAIHVHKMASEFKPKRPRLGYSNKSDKSYFESYADITVHEEMLADNVRTNAYRNAIFNCMPSMANKVVLDVGAGTGILSCFCAQAGASKVYAVEASSIAEQAKQVVKANGLDDKVIVLESLMEEIELPEKVDVIVSEWMGYCLLYESMLGSVITARDRWLKPGGLMLPSSAQMYLSPISDDEIVIEKVNFWLDMVDSYGVDMSALQSFARKSFSKDVMVKQITCENILANPQMIANLDLCTVTHQDISHVQHCFTFSSFGMADLQGFALWFDVKFPLRKQPVLDHEVQDTNQEDYIIPANNIEQKYDPSYSNHIETSLSSNSTNCSSEPSNLTLSTSPYKPETHWKQSILYLQQEKPVSQDSKISGNLVLKHSEENHRFLDISLSCVVDEKPVTPQKYFMGYELPKNTKENKTV